MNLESVLDLFCRSSGKPPEKPIDKGKDWYIKDGVLVITKLDYDESDNKPNQAFPRN